MPRLPSGVAGSSPSGGQKSGKGGVEFHKSLSTLERTASGSARSRAFFGRSASTLDAAAGGSARSSRGLTAASSSARSGSMLSSFKRLLTRGRSVDVYGTGDQSSWVLTAQTGSFAYMAPEVCLPLLPVLDVPS